jgi:uncharacterized protein YbbK (DUF523 family)
MAPSRPVAIISKCLLGYNCRYDGGSKPLPAEVVKKLREKFELLPFCPEEVAMPTPRPPARFIGDRLIDINGVDKTPQFRKGAEECLKLAKERGATYFIGKEKSPSCGIRQTSAYVNGQECKCSGMGLTAKLLAEAGLTLISEWDLIEGDG